MCVPADTVMAGATVHAAAVHVHVSLHTCSKSLCPLTHIAFQSLVNDTTEMGRGVAIVYLNTRVCTTECHALLTTLSLFQEAY